MITICGVCGTFSPEGRIDRSVVATMHERQLHRGPDETYSLNTAILAAKLGRLGMTGLADGWQPATDRSERYVAMTSGEVFNAESLREKLGLHRECNGVDVAVVPELVARRGIRGLTEVDGQFATVILDRAENALFLARDRMGICPMYYTPVGSTIHFSSELKPLVQGVPRSWKVDIGAVDQYLALGNIVAPRTLVEQVRAVEPGCAVRFDERGQDTVRYWRYGEFNPADEPVRGEELRETLQRAVADRLHADVEIGAYLSGGFDSSAILMESAVALDRPARTFSVVFDDPALDEGRFQREVAQAAGSKHEQIRCTHADIAANFERMVRHCCAPQRETYNVPAMMLADGVRSTGIKGVVSGEGADELFFGYDSYAFDSAGAGGRNTCAENERAWGRPDFSWEVNWQRIRRRRGKYLTAAAREALEGDEFWRTRLIPFSEEEVRSLSRMQLRSVADVYVQLAGHLLGDHGDAMLMGSSIEGRYPFLSNSMVTLAQRVSDDAKIVDFEGKACLKAAYEGVLPDSVVRRAKQGFTAYDLHSVVNSRSWNGWRDLIAANGVFAAERLDEEPVPDPVDKWDFRLSAISISIVMDELGLQL